MAIWVKMADIVERQGIDQIYVTIGQKWSKVAKMAYFGRATKHFGQNV